MVCTLPLPSNSLSCLIKNVHVQSRWLDLFLVLLHCPHFVQLVAVVVKRHQHVVLIVCQVYWVVQVQAWTVLVEQHSTSHTVDDEQTHWSRVLACQNRQVCEVHILVNHLAVVKQRNVRTLLCLVSRCWCNDFLTLIQVEVPNFHHWSVNLLPSHNSVGLLSVKVKMLFMGMTCSQPVPYCLVPVSNHKGLVVELVDRWKDGTGDSVQSLNGSVFFNFLQHQFFGSVVIRDQNCGLKFVVFS